MHAFYFILLLALFSMSLSQEEPSGWFIARNTVKYIMNTLRKASELNAIVEIGVHHGKSFISMVNNLPRNSNCMAVAIDVFDMQEFNYDKSGNGSMEIFKSNMRRYTTHTTSFMNEHVSVFQADSTQMTAADVFLLTKGRPVALFSVDGCHTSQCTLSDLELAFSTLSPNGIIMIDDYFNHNWPGVSYAVFTFLNKYEGQAFPIATGQNKYYIVKKSGLLFWKNAFDNWCRRSCEFTQLLESTMPSASTSFDDGILSGTQVTSRARFIKKKQKYIMTRAGVEKLKHSKSIPLVGIKCKANERAFKEYSILSLRQKNCRTEV